jgi:hypothetical protein
MCKWDLWERLVGAIERAQAELDLRKDEECFYRGHADSSWALLPTLHRVTLPAKPGTKKEATLRRTLEHDLFFEFQARARELHTMNLSQWDILFFMRHHGVPTRLLDWTESLGVALFFALDGYRSGCRPVRKLGRWRLRGLAVVEPKHAAEPLTALYCARSE